MTGTICAEVRVHESLYCENDVSTVNKELNCSS
jgi:hypothetical protein